jgi:DNA-directed RNA polymerase subunit M/transcription elongation factor TFIIS
MTGYNFFRELVKRASDMSKKEVKDNSLTEIQMAICDICGGDAFTTPKQTRSGDEGSNTVFICTDCGIERVIR